MPKETRDQINITCLREIESEPRKKLKINEEEIKSIQKKLTNTEDR